MSQNPARAYMDGGQPLTDRPDLTTEDVLVTLRARGRGKTMFGGDDGDE